MAQSCFHHALLVGLFLTALSVETVLAQEIDETYANELKNDASQNLKRLKAFREETKDNKIYDNEREKGLSLYLEEQERWDLIRDRGLREYKRSKRAQLRPENTPEYLEYLEEQESQVERYERSRRAQVITRNKVRKQIQADVGNLELEELGLVSERPRFSLRERANNKWVGKTGGNLGGASASAGFYTPPAPPPQSDFAPTDFPPAPPADAFNPGGFDEIQPAVPPPVFDSSMGQTFDGSQPDFNLPPPPPPPDFDF